MNIDAVSRIWLKFLSLTQLKITIFAWKSKPFALFYYMTQRRKKVSDFCLMFLIFNMNNASTLQQTVSFIYWYSTSKSKLNFDYTLEKTERPTKSHFQRYFQYQPLIYIEYCTEQKSICIHCANMLYGALSPRTMWL